MAARLITTVSPRQTFGSVPEKKPSHDRRCGTVVDIAAPPDGPSDVTESTVVPATPFAKVRLAGLKLHTEPTGKFPRQVRLTVLPSLLRGVIVSVTVPVCPAVIKMVGGFEIEKSGVVTCTGTFALVESAKFGSLKYWAENGPESCGVRVAVATSSVLPFASVVTVCVMGTGGTPPEIRNATLPASTGFFTEVVTVAVAAIDAP